jgi:shikimate dehydrogenase
VRVRDAGRAAETVEVLGRHPRAPQVSVAGLEDEHEDFQGADIVVSTIPAAAQTPALVERWAGVPVVFEVVYDPWRTPLAEAALASGRTLVSGLDLLVHQAARQVTLMTGAPDVPLPALRRAGEEALARRL